MLKGRILQEDTPSQHIYAPKIRAPKHIRKIMEYFKKDIDINTIIVGDFNTPLSTMDRSSKQRLKKDIVALSDTLDQIDLIAIDRTFHPTEAKYIFLSSTHGTFSKVDHKTGHKISPNKFKKIEIISMIFSEYSGFKVETNLKEKKKTKQNSKTVKFMETE